MAELGLELMPWDFLATVSYVLHLGEVTPSSSKGQKSAETLALSTYFSSQEASLYLILADT